MSGIEFLSILGVVLLFVAYGIFVAWIWRHISGWLWTAYQTIRDWFGHRADE